MCADGRAVWVADRSGGSLPNEALMKRAGSSRQGCVRPARLLSGLVTVLPFSRSWPPAASAAYHCSIHPFITGTIIVK